MAAKTNFPAPKEKRQNSGVRGARRTRLTELQKILLVNGGAVHRSRHLPKQGKAPKRTLRERAERAA